MTAPQPTLIRADARALPIANDTVDLVVTSPPYWSQRSYEDGGEHYERQIGAEPTPHDFIDSLLAVTRECMRVLKPSGSLWVNLGDKYNSASRHQNGVSSTGTMHSTGTKAYRGQRTRVLTTMPLKTLMGIPWRYAIRCIDELGLTLRAEVVWSKLNGLPESATDRVRRSHETWFHFTLQPYYFAEVDELREGHSGYARGPAARKTPPGRQPRAMADTCNPGGRLPSSVWEVPIQPLKVPAELNVAHFAAFPMEFPRRIITAWCPRDGVVLDPFGGTGTTALVAAMHGRRGISVDASADYCRLAAWRSSDPKERARAAGLDPEAVAQIRPEVRGQTSLLDLTGESA